MSKPSCYYCGESEKKLKRWKRWTHWFGSFKWEWICDECPYRRLWDTSYAKKEMTDET